MGIVAVHMQKKVDGETKDLAIAICISLSYMGLHYLYMNGHYRFPIFQEFPWRGLHLLFFFFPLTACLKAMRSANKKNIKLIKTPVDQAA
jgi:TM2 domain-containing membrane protein YozV